MKKIFLYSYSKLLIIILGMFFFISNAYSINTINRTSTTKGDAILIGDAIYNFFVKCSTKKQCDDFRTSINLDKSGHTLLNVEEKRILENKIKNQNTDSFLEMGVGSATNTIKVIAKLGGKTAFIGNVGEDKAGDELYENLYEYGIKTFIDFEKEKDTAVSFIFVDPDGTRSMATYIGAAQEYSKNEIQLSAIKDYKMLIIEAYAFGATKESLNTILNAINYAKDNKVKLAFTLGAKSVVKRYREDILKIIPKFNIIFGNKDEFITLFGSDNIIAEAQKLHSISVITMGEDGALIVTPEKVYKFNAQKVEKIVDKTGAGDTFAGGFLYKYLVKEENLEQCGEFGIEIASKIIQKFGTTLDE